MQIYISADIEGTCGIADWSETERKTMDDYRPFQQQMTREVAAACAGAVAAGAEDILLKDAHDTARNLDPTALPRETRILRGWTGDPLSMMSGLDSAPFGAVLFTGYHAWAACPGNPLSHTMNLGNEYVAINGVRASEFPTPPAITACRWPSCPATPTCAPSPGRSSPRSSLSLSIGVWAEGWSPSTRRWRWSASGRAPRRR